MPFQFSLLIGLHLCILLPLLEALNPQPLPPGRSQKTFLLGVLSTSSNLPPVQETEAPPRLLQDNPLSPTGQTMNTIPGTQYDNGSVLTIGLINQITQQNGSNVKPNITSSGTQSQAGSNLSGQSNYNYSNPNAVLGNITWVGISVDSLAYNPAWISASGFLNKLNLSYNTPNQICLLNFQNISLGTAFNITYKSSKGYIRVIVLVNLSYLPLLISSEILNVQSSPVNATSLLYNVTLSLLQSLFYDFTLAPLTLINGTETNLSRFIIYDLNYQSKNGIYGFSAKSQLFTNGSIVSTVLACNLITVNVTTQTVPVLASLNLIKVDGNFPFVNNTIYNFITNTLNLSSPNLLYNSVVIWCNRAGSAILYYLNLTVGQSSPVNYTVGVSYNITYRTQTIIYWRAAQPSIPLYNPSNSGYQEIPYLQILSNSTFINVDMSARAYYPTLVVGPLVEIEVSSTLNGAAYRLTYFGVNGQHVQAVYTP